MSRVTKKEKREAIERLRDVISPGDTLHLILRSVSRSGMCRRIAIKKIVPQNGHEAGILHLDHNVNLALGQNPGEKDNGDRMDGCGMDMGFQLVYNLSHALFPDNVPRGYAIKHKWL